MTGNELIEDIVRLLLSGSREEMNKLNASTSSGATSLTFRYPLGAIQEGAQLSIGNEIFRVWEVDPDAKTAVVDGAILGSPTAAHANGDLVYVNPRFPRWSVFTELNNEIRSLSSPSNGLFRIAAHTFTWRSNVTDYPLPSDVIDVYDVEQEDPGPSKFRRRMRNWTWNPKADTSDFEYGASIHLPEGYPGRTVRVIYKTAFTALTDPTQDLASTAQVPLEMQDILKYGVQLRLGPFREIKRNFTEAQPGEAHERVPAGAVTNSFSWVNKLRQQRITEERTRLERLYPVRHPAK